MLYRRIYCNSYKQGYRELVDYLHRYLVALEGGDIRVPGYRILGAALTHHEVYHAHLRREVSQLHGLGEGVAQGSTYNIKYCSNIASILLCHFREYSLKVNKHVCNPKAILLNTHDFRFSIAFVVQYLTTPEKY